MFKNIQNKIIFSYPLLWNIKLFPMFIILGIFHLFSFIVGYFHGTLDLEYSFLLYEYQESWFIIIASLVMFLIFILWIYYYMRNNAFEHFYPKKAFDIYKEWLLILLIIFLIVGFPITYFFGKETKIRSYISKEKLINEIDILEKASIFMKGIYKFEDFKYIKDYETMEEIPDSLVNENSIKIIRDSIKFNFKNYPYYSIFNKSINGIYFNDKENDSLKEKNLKILLQNNDKMSVKNIFDEYLKIQKRYKHQNNLTSSKWLNIIYNHPYFEEKIFIGQTKNSENELYNNEYSKNYSNQNNLDSIAKYNLDKYQEIFKNSVTFYHKNGNEYYKYNHFTDYNTTKKLLEIFIDAYNFKQCDFSLFFGLFYFAGFLSLILFLYKMIQWKNWLLTVVCSIIVSIVIGILALIIDNIFSNNFEEIYILSSILIVFTVIISLFLYFIYKKPTKKFIGILLGLTQAIIPIILIIIILFLSEIIKEFSGYNDYITNNFLKVKEFPVVNFFNDLIDLMFYINIIFVIIVMYPFSVWIKKWKSLPEA